MKRRSAPLYGPYGSGRTLRYFSTVGLLTNNDCKASKDVATPCSDMHAAVHRGLVKNKFMVYVNKSKKN